MSANAAVSVDEAIAPDFTSTVVDGLRAQLQSLRDVVAALPTHVYQSAPSSASGSIGAQVRHCLDHVRAVVRASDAERLSYDSRARGTLVELDPTVALDELDRLTASLDVFTPSSLDRTVELMMQINRHTDVRLQTTIGREVAFVIQHTIHHNAIVRMLIERVGFDAAEEFGYAPSTLAAHR